jgi:hypothetical protein
MSTTKRRRRHAREKALLTEGQELDLLLGPGSAFESDEERRQAWFRHRDELIYAVSAFTRPHAFWRYETDRGNLRYQASRAYLTEHPKLLSEEERRILKTELTEKGKP